MTRPAITDEAVEKFGQTFWSVNARSKIDADYEGLREALGAAFCLLIQPVTDETDEMARMKAAFEWLEQQAKESRTGISFDWVPSAEGEPSGWRFMRHHFIGDAKKSLFNAIEAARLGMLSWRSS